MGVKRVSNKKNYHWEIWKWEVEYEKVQKATVSRNHYLTSTTNVYEFLSSFPEKRTAREFLITDLVDFLISLQRSRNYSHNSCARVGHDIAAFWNWMRRFKDPDLPNMRVESFETIRMKVPALTESQFLKLCDATRSDSERLLLREALIGTAPRLISDKLGIDYRALQYRWDRMRERAGVPWATMRTLSKSYRGMLLRLGADTLTRLVGERTNVEPPVPAIPYNDGTVRDLADESV